MAGGKGKNPKKSNSKNDRWKSKNKQQKSEKSKDEVSQAPAAIPANIPEQPAGPIYKSPVYGGGKLKSHYGAVCEAAERMIEHEKLKYVPAAGAWYLYSFDKHHRSEDMVKTLKISVPGPDFPKMQYMQVLPSMTAAQAHYIKRPVYPMYFDNEFGLILQMSIDERRAFLKDCGFDQYALGDDEIYDFGMLLTWLRANENVNRYFFEANNHLGNLDGVMFQAELHGSMKEHKNVGEVLCEGKKANLQGTSSLVYLWNFLTLQHRRRNNVLKYFWEYYSHGEFGDHEPPPDKQVRTTRDYMLWLTNLFLKGINSNQLGQNPMEAKEHALVTLADLIQVEIESRRQKQIREELLLDRATKLLSIDVLLLVNDDVRTEIARHAGIKLEHIKCLKTGNEVAYLMSRGLNFDDHRFTETFLPFWKFDLGIKADFALLKKPEFPGDALVKFYRLETVGELFDWMTSFMIVECLEKVVDEMRDSETDSDQLTCKLYDADMEMLREECKKWKTLLGKQDPVGKEVREREAAEEEAAKIQETKKKKAEEASKSATTIPLPLTQSKESLPPQIKKSEPEQEEMLPEVVDVTPDPLVSSEADSSEKELSEEEECLSEEEDPKISGFVTNSDQNHYMISIFQMLTHLPDFMAAPECIRTVDACLTCHLRQLAHQSLDLEKLDSNEFWKTQRHWRNATLKGLKKTAEEDALSFFCALIDECDNHVDNTFTMSSVSTFRCTECQNIVSSDFSLLDYMTVTVVHTTDEDAPDPHYATLSNLMELQSKVVPINNRCSLCNGTEAAVQRTVEDPGRVFAVKLHEDPSVDPGRVKKVYITETITIGEYSYCVNAVLVYVPGDSAHYLSYVINRGQWWLVDGNTIREANCKEFYEDSNTVQFVLYRRTGTALHIDLFGPSPQKPTAKESKVQTDYEKLKRNIEEALVFNDLKKETMNQKTWQPYNDLGVVVVANDVKVGKLVRAQLCTDFMRESQPDVVLQTFIDSANVSAETFSESNEETTSLFENFAFIVTLTPDQYGYATASNERQVLHKLQQWKGRTRVEAQKAQYQSFLAIFGKIFTEYSSYKWPKKIVSLCNSEPAMLTGVGGFQMEMAASLTTSLAADRIICNAIKKEVLQMILQLQPIPMYTLIQKLTDYTKAKPRIDFKTNASEVNRIRNIIIYHRKDHTFPQGKKDEFLEAFKSIVTNFNFEECFLLGEKDSMEEEYLKTQVTYEFYTDILTTYSELFTGYQKMKTKFSTTKEETENCMVKLCECYDNVNQEKRYVNDQTYF